MKRAVLFLAIPIVFLCIEAPRTATGQVIQPLYVIDHPTAGILEHGFYEARGRAGGDSSVLLYFGVGFKDIFQIGASFGMQNLLGYGGMDLNDKIGFQARLRLIQESNAPALAVGFDNQGQGKYLEDAERYDRKSVGFYVTLSKNYQLVLGQLLLNGGVSFTTERKDDNDPNLFFGVAWTLADRFSFVLDTDAALNDNANDSSYGQGGVYVDAGLRWFYGDSLVLTLIFRDLTGNFGPNGGRIGREFELALIESF